MASISLVHGWLPPLVWVLGIAGLLLLLLPRRGRRWFPAYPLLLACAVAATWGTYLLLVYVWRVIPEALPLEVLGWAALGVFGVLLGLHASVRARWRWRVAGSLGTVAVLLLAGLQMNAYFGQYITLGSLFGEQMALPALSLAQQGNGAAQQGPAAARQGKAAGQVVAGRGSRDGAGGTARHHASGLAASWNPPPGMPAHGTLAQAPIPGTVSGFAARDAMIYLPPAYLASRAVRLPVLVLVAGQPGGPQRWLDAGNLGPIMDAFAAAHRGLAPVVVVADPNGTASGNSMCMDSRIARADTYLAVDVPNWISRTLNVQTETSGWAFGGFSFGGTCALQMGTLHPRQYPNIIDLSGQREPALSVSRADAIAKAFGGDVAAFDARLPLTLLHERRYPDSHAFFSVGALDRHYGPDMDEVASAARLAGMDVRAVRVPGDGHSWTAAQSGLAMGLDFLAPTWGMVK